MHHTVTITSSYKCIVLFLKENRNSYGFLNHTQEIVKKVC